MDFNSEVCGPEIVVLEEGLNGGGGGGALVGCRLKFGYFVSSRLKFLSLSVVDKTQLISSNAC